jgi:hypothetical protein
MSHIRSAPCTPVQLLVLASAALAGPERCTTNEEKTLGRWQTLCPDGARATSYWNRTLERWETTIQRAPGPRRSCTTRMHPHMQHVDIRCQ